MGHERRFGPAPTMSQLPLIADIETDVGAVEKGHMRTLADRSITSPARPFERVTTRGRGKVVLSLGQENCPSFGGANNGTAISQVKVSVSVEN